MGSIPKQVALYVFRPETDYTCGDKCIFWNKNVLDARCAIYGKDTEIKTFGGCNVWIHGDPSKFDIPWIGLLTKEETGYIENREGFSCKRCEYFNHDKLDCQKIDKDSPGDTPGIIHPNACCNHWEKK